VNSKFQSAGGTKGVMFQPLDLYTSNFVANQKGSNKFHDPEENNTKKTNKEKNQVDERC
jgi:hypothetical protein